jgi:hypothetical protein
MAALIITHPIASWRGCIVLFYFAKWNRVAVPNQGWKELKLLLNACGFTFEQQSSFNAMWRPPLGVFSFFF